MGGIQRLGVIKSGELEGSTSATQFPDVPCIGGVIQAQSGNTGTVYIGGSGVTVPAGSSDTTSGFAMSAGDTFQIPAPIKNLNQFYYVCSDANQDISYIVVQ